MIIKIQVIDEVSGDIISKESLTFESALEDLGKLERAWESRDTDLVVEKDEEGNEIKAEF